MPRRKYTDVERNIMKGIATNLKIHLDQRGWSQKDLADITGLSTSVINDYMKEKTLATPGSLQLIADALNVKKSEIDPSFSNSTVDTISLPVVGNISCGNGNFAYEDIKGYEETPRSWVQGGEYFYLRAEGDSMINARILDGDLVLIRQQAEVEDGEIAAVLVNDKTYLKRVYKRNGTLILQSENPKYPPVIYGPQDNIRIIGKLKKIIINA